MAYNEYESVEVSISDLEDLRTILKACAGILFARDLEDAQMKLAGQVRTSPLRGEVERIEARLGGLIGDYLLEKRDRELEELEREDDEDADEVEQDLERPDGDYEDEPLASNPLGSGTPKRQRGRRVTATEA